MTVSSISAAVSRGPGPAEVHDILRRHLITDGLDLVLDLDESHGAWMRCARTGRDFLDCFSYFATNAIGHNHPGVTNPAFLERLGRVAVHKPSNSDFYTVEMARFLDTFSRLAIPEGMPHAFFVAGGSVAVENALKTAFGLEGAERTSPPGRASGAARSSTFAKPSTGEPATRFRSPTPSR